MRKIIEQKKSKTIEQNASKTIDFITYLENMLSEGNSPTTTFGEIITRNLMTGTEQSDQVLLPTEIGGSVKFLVGIANQFRTNRVNWTDHTLQSTIFHSNKYTELGYNDHD